MISEITVILCIELLWLRNDLKEVAKNCRQLSNIVCLLFKSLFDVEKVAQSKYAILCLLVLLLFKYSTFYPFFNSITEFSPLSRRLCERLL